MTGPYVLPARLDPAEPRHRVTFTVEIDGRRVTAHAGQTVAAVLMALGRTAWRDAGGKRGVFCGVGVCHECVLAVNGVAGVRACRRRVEPGDQVSTGESR